MKYALLSLLLFAATACARDSAEIPDHNPTLIVTYEVPEATEYEVESVINSILGVGEDGERIGRARVLPNNLVVVSAPAAVHPGIDRFIKQLWDKPIASTQRIRIHYWLVRGTPGSGQVDDSLSDIETALNDLASTAGPMHFERLDYVQHALRSGAHAGVEGGEINGNVEAAARGDRIALDLNLAAPTIRSSVRTQMDLNNGETVVLAQMGGQTRDGENPDAVHVFVIRAENF